MFCPQCGQQQAISEVRFCQRCGFQLAAVAGLLATNGAPLVSQTEGDAAAESPRRRGVRQGAALMMIGIFIIPLFFILNELFGVRDEIGMIGLLGIIGGFLRILYAAFFESGKPAARALEGAGGGVTAALGKAPRAAELPPAYTAPARAYAAARPDTSELVQRPSVTEGTTRLLDEEADPRAR
jgi:hypothetical protein